MKRIFSLALITFVSTMSFVAVFAKSEPSVGLSPSPDNQAMSYEAKPGASLEDQFFVQNLGSQKADFEVYFADLEGVDSSAALGFKSWASLSDRYVTLDPGQIRPVKFFVNIPADAAKEKVYKGKVVARLQPAANQKKVKALGADKAGGNIAITSEVAMVVSLKVTDNPGIKNADASQSTAGSLDGTMRNAAILLVVLLVISLGYLFYRKK